MDLSTVPTDVLQGIASGQGQDQQAPQQGNQQDLSSVPDDVLQKIASGQTPDENTQGDISSVSGFSPMPQEPMQAQQQGQLQGQQQSQDSLNIGDHAALSFLNNPQDQQNYLQKKFPYVVPDGKGNYMVGQTPGTSKLVSPSGSGNGFFSWLASQADQILPTAGMVVGAAEGPLGAGAGAMAGEALNKVIGSTMGANESPLKMGVDTAISGAFGVIGQKAAEMFGLSAGKLIAPKLAKMVDGKLSQIVQSGGDPSKFINFVSKAVHFASGADAEDVKTLMQYGVNKSLSDPTVNNKNAIINIAQNIVEATQAKRAALGAAVGASNRALLEKASNVPLQNKPIFDYLKQEIQTHPGWGTINGNIVTLNKNVANSNDSTQLGNLLTKLGAQEIRTPYQAPKTSEFLRHATDVAKSTQYDINNPTHQPFIEKVLGVQPGTISNELEKSATAQQEFATGGPKAFKLPTNETLDLRKGVAVKDIFGQLTDKDKTTLSDDMQRVFSNVIYRDPNSISEQLSKAASANGVDSYVANNAAYKSLMKSIEGVQQNGFDPFNPKSIQDYGKHINDRPPIDNLTLSNFEQNLGKPVLDDLKRYSAIQKLSNYNPNFLRLGLISGALGGMIGDGDFESRLSRGAGFALGIPLALKNTLRATEAVGNTSKSVLNGLLRASPYVTSQAGAKALQALVGNKNNNNANKK